MVRSTSIDEAVAPWFVVSLCFLATVPLRGDITVGGDRPVTVRVPASYDANVPAPLLILLHGFTGSGSAFESQAKLAPLAASRGMLYAHPDGTRDSQGRTFWNATDGCCNATGSVVDDSSYLRGIIDETKSLLNVDERRVYLAGWSNGGFMSYRMACDHADTIAAIVSFAGATFLDPARCTPAEPVHILQMHGTADSVILYNGGRFLGLPAYPGAPAGVEMWAGLNGCLVPGDRSAAPLDLYSELAGAETTVLRHAAGCNPGGSAELWTIAGADHTPPFSTLQVDGVATSRFASFAIEWLLDHPKRPIPSASIAVSPASGPGPLTVSVDGGGSSTPEGTEIIAYEWDFGDGSTAEGITAMHEYQGTGRYSAALTIRTTDGGRVDRATAIVSVFCPSEELAPWVSSNVGNPPFLGGARREAGGGQGDLRVCAGGRDLVGLADEHFLLHQDAVGDVAITARLSEPSGANTGYTAGVMLRASLEADAVFAFMFVQSQVSGPRFRFRVRSSDGKIGRPTWGDNVDSTASPWVRIERQGDKFRGWSSLDGESWSLVAEAEVPGLPGTLHGGFAAAARDTVPSDITFVPLGIRVSGLEIAPLVAAPRMRRGDCNDDGAVDISDAVATLGSLFLGEGDPGCLDACDANDDGLVDISDAIATLGVLFLGSGAIPLPGTSECGVDPTEDEAGCARHGACP